MLPVKTGLLLLAFYGSLFHSHISFCILSLSSLAYFCSEADSLTQLSCSCHTCAQKKTVLKGGFCFGVCCEQHDPFLLNLPKRHEAEGLPWDSTDTLYPRAVCGVTS